MGFAGRLSAFAAVHILRLDRRTIVRIGSVFWYVLLHLAQGVSSSVSAFCCKEVIACPYKRAHR